MDDKTAASIAEYDHDWLEWQAAKPDDTFAEFSLVRILKKLRNGRPHPKLGGNLSRGLSWEEDGKADYKVLCKHNSSLKPASRVLEYGCGTLRLGVHFIKSQMPDCYFGLDVSDELLDYGRALIGGLQEEKSPQIGTIKHDMDAAIAFKADVVFAMNVLQQVHPDEMEYFCENIRLLAHNRRSIIILHAYISAQPFRYSRGGWARPMAYFDDHMAPFLRTKSSLVSEGQRHGEKLEGWLLTYVPR